jgi:hypothetical protein
LIDVVGFLAEIAIGVLLHLRHHQLLVEGAAVDADAHGLPWSIATWQMVANCSSRRLPVPTLPGLMRYLSSAARTRETRQQQVTVVVKVADERRRAAGIEHARLISGTAAAASGRLTVTRTISDPACHNSMHCCAVDAASAVSVIVIDCTTTGAPPPTLTCRPHTNVR